MNTREGGVSLRQISNYRGAELLITTIHRTAGRILNSLAIHTAIGVISIAIKIESQL